MLSLGNIKQRFDNQNSPETEHRAESGYAPEISRKIGHFCVRIGKKLKKC